MALIAASFLILAQDLARTFLSMKLPDGFFDCAIAIAVLEIVDGLVDKGLVVSDHANGMNRGQRAKIPLKQQLERFHLEWWPWVKVPATQRTFAQ